VIVPQELLSSGNQLQMAAFLIALRAKVSHAWEIIQ